MEFQPEWNSFSNKAALPDSSQIVLPTGYLVFKYMSLCDPLLFIWSHSTLWAALGLWSHYNEICTLFQSQHTLQLQSPFWGSAQALLNVTPYKSKRYIVDFRQTMAQIQITILKWRKGVIVGKYLTKVRLKPRRKNPNPALPWLKSKGLDGLHLSGLVTIAHFFLFTWFFSLYAVKLSLEHDSWLWHF